MINTHCHPVVFTLLLDGPGVDLPGRDWVLGHLDPDRPEVYPPDLLVADAHRCVLHRFDFRVTATTLLQQLAPLVGAAVAAPVRDLDALEEGARAGGSILAELRQWRSTNGLHHPDDTVRCRILEGVVHWRAGRFAAARRIWRAVVEANPDHPMAHRARYHLLDPEAWPTGPHPDLRGATPPHPDAGGDALWDLGAGSDAPTGIAWVPIPAGTFQMGGSPALLARELPRRRVTLTRSFRMSATVVTRGQWHRFDADRYPRGRDGLPATGVSYPDALAFCRWASQVEGGIVRLPTEAEWEWAARGGLDEAPYPWGNADIDAERCNFGEPGPGAVARYPPNGYGLFDMVGNTQEWTADPFGERAYDGPGEVIDPQGPAVADGGLALRAVRGGLVGADVCQIMCRNSFRVGTFEGYTGGSMGVRVVNEVADGS